MRRCWLTTLVWLVGPPGQIRSAWGTNSSEGGLHRMFHPISWRTSFNWFKNSPKCCSSSFLEPPNRLYNIKCMVPAFFDEWFFGQEVGLRTLLDWRDFCIKRLRTLSLYLKFKTKIKKWKPISIDDLTKACPSVQGCQSQDELVWPDCPFQNF
jgi:hypothetical protein